MLFVLGYSGGGEEAVGMSAKVESVVVVVVGAVVVASVLVVVVVVVVGVLGGLGALGGYDFVVKILLGVTSCPTMPKSRGHFRKVLC